jgi:hypothetical protein
MKTLKYICLIALMFTICSCSSRKKEKEEPPKPAPLNISVLVDLSDRITKTPNNVEQQEKDIELIRHIVNSIKEKAISSKLVCQDKFQILFYPEPQLDSIAEISANLRFDMHCKTLKERPLLKQKLKSMDSLFTTNLNSIYHKTKVTKQWSGSDIWGFFENKVQEYCIKDGYRNVLVILTDGYIYHNRNTRKEDGKYTFILPRVLRDNPDARLLNPFEKNSKLDQLDVLILELNPNPQNHEKLLKTILQEWLDEMGVNKHKVLTTDLPSNIKPLIDDFIFNK